MARGAISSIIDRLDSLYEFEREPVSEDKLHGWMTYIAMFSSIHIAGTEFVLGILLVLHGVSVFDVFVGLAMGNMLAVLSWAFVCAPIAVRERLTVYWQIRRIAGPYLMVLYSGLFASILCLLGGSMVSVSTTAIALICGIPSPNFLAGETVPSGAWIAVAVAVGTVMSALAILGFERLAYFAKLSAPWTPLIFLAGAIASLPMLGVENLGDFWEVASEKIWTGVAQEGQLKYDFWSCVSLAWLCNITQHIGMGDMTIFRFANARPGTW